ncbi:hypothetical protein [Salinispora arenicola]|uniref:hypothetical protein n=1 Tax=Salinispora arenicola TaxID=168697 RepID=UPI0027DE16E9|nr:hypothetical protein [Salinispora arenicola]
MKRSLLVFVAAGLLAAGCSSATTAQDSGASQSPSSPAPTAGATSTSSGAGTGFRIDVWADNWSAVYIDGEQIGEDSVPITTERSFNAETYTFDAQMPFTVSIEAMDFKETDSGIEYIGEPNQQMGDGGIIAQITDLATGEVVAATDADWKSLVVQRAPLNTDCADDPNPDETCESATVGIPADWTSPEFDDSAWVAATECSPAEVDPKGGYEEVTWDPAAQLIWGTDLEVDNTILLRMTVS